MEPSTAIPADQSVSFSYFKNQQKNLIENFANDFANEFRSAGIKFGEEYDNFVGNYIENKNDIYNEKMKKVEMLYRMYCMLHGQIKHKEATMEKISETFRFKNLTAHVFNKWIHEFKYQKYLDYMKQFTVKYHNKRKLSLAFKNWRENTMEEKKFEIKYKIAKNAEKEIEKNQREYESVIKNLEQILQEKLMELRREEESQKILYERYEGLNERVSVD